MTEQEVRQRLDKYVERFRTKSAAAERLGVSSRYLRYLLRGHYPIPEWLLTELGVRMVYEEVTC